MQDIGGVTLAVAAPRIAPVEPAVSHNALGRDDAALFQRRAELVDCLRGGNVGFGHGASSTAGRTLAAISRSRLSRVMKVLAPMWTTSRRGISSYSRDLLNSPRYRQASGMLASAGRKELTATTLAASVLPRATPSARTCFFIGRGVHRDVGGHLHYAPDPLRSRARGAEYLAGIRPE